MLGKTVTGATVGFVVLLAAATAEAAPPGKAVWIYTNHPKAGADESRSEVELKFAPYGFMPPERTHQIAVNTQYPLADDPEGGTCIEYSFKFGHIDDWQGVYTLVGGDSWGTKPGINVQKLLGVPHDAVVHLRFSARGTDRERVTFQCGGVTTGRNRSSIALKKTVQPNPVRLTKEFTEFSIPFTAEQLSNVVDPFCVVAAARDNRQADVVTVYVDNIRFEVPGPPEDSRSLPKGWRQRLAETLFIAYTPTAFDPTKQPAIAATRENIDNDLRAIRAFADENGVNGHHAGIVTYGCRDGLELIPDIAKAYGLSVITGIFNPRDEVEVANIEKLLRRQELRSTIVACCVGNEALTFRRGTFEDICRIVGKLRAFPVPITTTEVVDMYGDDRLFQFDFTLANVHAIFSGAKSNPEVAAKWTANRIRDLVAAAPKDHLVLIKEIGWPAGPEPEFNHKQQADFWKTVLQEPIAKKVNICVFDGMANVPWKNEPVTVRGNQVNVGPHWAVLFDANRRPTPFSSQLIQLWRLTH